MRNRFQWLSAALAAFMLLSLVAGCGNSSSGSSTSAPKKFDNVKLNVLVSSGHQQFAPLWEALPKFKDETGIDVNLIQVPTGEIRAKMLQDFQLGGNSYDVVEIPDDTLSAAAQYMEPLEPYLAKDKIDLAKWKSDQVKWAIDAATWDGKLIYYPFYAGSVAAVYRKDIFDNAKEQEAFKAKYGYDLPRPPKNRKELLDVAQFFTRPPDLYGLVFPGTGETGQNVMEHLIFQAGFPYLDDNHNSLWGPKYPGNQAAVTAEAKFIQDLIQTQKVTPPQITGMTSNESSAFYSSGKAAMMIDLIYLSWNQLNSSTVTSAIGRSESFSIPPAGTDKGGVPFYWMRSIVKASKNKDAAWAFMKWVMDPENLKLSLDKGKGVFVPTDIAVADWAVGQNKLPKAIVDAVKKAQRYPVNSSIGRARQLLRPKYEELTLNKITPAEFTKQTGEAIQALMKEAGLAK